MTAVPSLRALVRGLPRTVATGGLVAVAAVGVYASLYGYEWLAPVAYEWHPPPLLAGPTLYSTVYLPYSLATLGLIVLGVPAVVLASRRRRYRRPAAALVAVLGLTVLGLQAVTVAQVVEFERTADYLLHYVLYDVLVGGFLVALAICRRGRRVAGFVLWGMGVLTVVAALGYVFVVSGADGLWRGLLFVSVGTYVALGTGTLLLVGGPLLARPVDPPDEASAPAEKPMLESDRDVRYRLTGVRVLVAGAVVASVVGIRIGWTLWGWGLFETGRPASLSVLALAWGGIALAVCGGLASMRRRRERAAGPVVFLAGATVLGASLVHSHVSPIPPGPGLYVSAGAGIVLLVAGALICADVSGGLSGATPGTVRFTAVPLAPVLVIGPGLALVPVGVVLRWLVRLPQSDATGVPTATVLGGVAAPHLVAALVVVGVLGWVAVSTRAPPLGGLALLTTGLVTAAVPLGWLLTTVGPTGLVDGESLVAPGAYVTLLGTALLAIGGTLQGASTAALPPKITRDDETAVENPSRHRSRRETDRGP